tara:strand:+ start:2520 stop:3011 length:492 start_codon:yes stop_codon:yes gene_type:complete
VQAECIKLFSTDIVKHQDIILEALKASLPPTFSGDGDESEARFIQALVSDLMQCWVVRSDGVMKCLCVTMISGDQFSLEKDLLIYAMYGMGEFDQYAIRRGMDVLGRYAKGLGCKRVAYYTEHDSMIKSVAGTIGVEPLVQSYVSFDVDEIISPQQVVEEVGA